MHAKVTAYPWWSVSGVVKELVWVGLGVSEEGGVEYVGPFGVGRRFATMVAGGGRERLTIWLDEELVARMEHEFGENARRVLREALRLGALVFKPNMMKIVGPFGRKRLFALVEISDIRNERTRQALKRLQSIAL